MNVGRVTNVCIDIYFGKISDYMCKYGVVITRISWRYGLFIYFITYLFSVIKLINLTICWSNITKGVIVVFGVRSICMFTEKVPKWYFTNEQQKSYFAKWAPSAILQSEHKKRYFMEWATNVLTQVIFHGLTIKWYFTKWAPQEIFHGVSTKRDIS